MALWTTTRTLITHDMTIGVFAGAALQLGSLQPSVRLQTTPLTMNVQQVQSEAAMAATGGQWSAFLGSPDDRLPEMPPDGESEVPLHCRAQQHWWALHPKLSQ